MSTTQSLPDDHGHYTLATLLDHWDHGELTLDEVFQRWPRPDATRDEIARELLHTILGVRMRVSAIDGLTG